MKATRRVAFIVYIRFKKQSLHHYGEPLFPRGSPKNTSKETAGQTHRPAPMAKAIRHKNRKTNNAGAHRCVRPKYTQANNNNCPSD